MVAGIALAVVAGIASAVVAVKCGGGRSTGAAGVRGLVFVIRGRHAAGWLGAMGSTAREPQNRAGSHEADMRANGQQTGAMGASAAGSPCCERAQAAGSACSEVVLRPDGRRTAGSPGTAGSAASRGTELAQAAGGCDPLRKGASAGKLTSMGDAMNRVSTAKAQDVTDGVIDFNGMEG